MNNFVKHYISLALATFTATSVFADDDNREFARTLESKTISAAYKPYFFSGSKTAVIAVDSSQNISASFEQFPELGNCSGKMVVTDNDIYSNHGKLIMDVNGLVCTGEPNTYFRIMLAVLAINPENGVGVGYVNLQNAKGRFIISSKKARLSIK